MKGSRAAADPRVFPVWSQTGRGPFDLQACAGDVLAAHGDDADHAERVLPLIFKAAAAMADLLTVVNQRNLAIAVLHRRAMDAALPDGWELHQVSGAVTVVDDQGRRLALHPNPPQDAAALAVQGGLGHVPGMGPQHWQAGYSDGRLLHLAHQLALSGRNAYRRPLTPTDHAGGAAAARPVEGAPMPRFDDLTESSAPPAADPIELPIRGNTYTFPPTVPLAVGLELRRVQKALADPNRKPGDVVVDDDDAFYARLIGDDQLARMKADAVSDREYRRVGNTLMSAYLYGPVVAELVWTGAAAGLAAGTVTPEQARAAALKAANLPVKAAAAKPKKAAARKPRGQVTAPDREG